MGTLRAWRGYSTDGTKKARREYRCEVCNGKIERGQPYERVLTFPVHLGAAVGLKGLDCNPFEGEGNAPDCPGCREKLLGYYSAAGYPVWGCPNCDWQSVEIKD